LGKTKPCSPRRQKLRRSEMEIVGSALCVKPFAMARQ
jgi:hypothetical protein